MAKLHVIFVLALVLAIQSSARNIPTDQTKPSDHTTRESTNALAPKADNSENVFSTKANAPVASGVGDKKCGIWAGMGGFGGLGGVTGLGGIGGLGGVGGLGGASGLGGLGGGLGIGGGVGGVAGVGGIIP